MASKLFRKKTFNIQQNKTYGARLIIRLPSTAAFTGAVLLIAAVIISFLFWGQYTRKAYVTGYLIPSRDMIKVVASRSGIVLGIHVKEGQVVKRGEILLIIASHRTTAFKDETQAREKLIERPIILTAPADGTVTTILAAPGQAVNSASTVLSILPQGVQVEAQLLIPVSSASFIRVGQTVALRYQAFSYQRFGHFLGEITEIEKTVIQPGGIEFFLASAEPMYWVKVRLPEQKVNTYGQPVSLQIGMQLDAYISIDRRQIFAQLFHPIVSMINRV